MVKLPLCIAPDSRLSTKCEPVDKIDDELRKVLDDMLETMYANEGVGLAANQVGITKRMFVMDVTEEGEKPNPIKMINPEITWVSDSQVPKPQGCLSVPNAYNEVTRPEKLTVQYLDENGKEQEMTADGWLAVCIQHEMDHINGKLFIDHLSSIKRRIIMQKLKTNKRKIGKQ